MTQVADPARLTASEAARAIATGELRSETLVRACLERIRSRDAEIRAWVHLDEELALVMARARDAQPEGRGPLHGVPVGIKDIIDTEELPSERGSVIHRGRRPGRDAAATAMLRAAGAVILGKTVTTEFACGGAGATRNPHHPGHTPGGSSSGSGAAVADYQVPLALGTQTAGSVIRPAAYNGVPGLKPSYGTVARDGVSFVADSLDTIGWYGRSIEDLALVLGVYRGGALPALDALVDERAARGLRLALCRTPDWSHAGPGVAEALDDAADALRALGASVEAIELPPEFDDLGEAQNAIMCREMTFWLRAEWHDRRDDLSDHIKARLALGERVGAGELRDAVDLVMQSRRAMPAIFERYDAIIAPSAPGEAPAGLAGTGNPILNRIWTVLQLPCVAVPVRRGPGGLPVGVQLVGALGSDARLLAVAERAWRALGSPAGVDLAA
ncbi:MAG: amidase [Chloroflexi bacterium]|nr:amidase [Chloroflexota bacterium]